MPQELKEAKGDTARRRPYIIPAIPLRLPDFVVPGIIHPDLEDSMVAASVAPPSFEQCRHSAYHFGVLSKILVKLMTRDMFGQVTQFEGRLLEKTTFASSPFLNDAREEMIMNDRPTARNIGGKEMLSIRITPSVSDRLPEIKLSEIDFDNAFQTLAFTLSRRRARRGRQRSVSCGNVSK